MWPVEECIITYICNWTNDFRLQDENSQIYTEETQAISKVSSKHFASSKHSISIIEQIVFVCKRKKKKEKT